MSVVIRGMNMPKSCDECDLNYDCFRCILPIESSLLYGKDTANGRLPNCPLVELPPHGRLIEASEVKDWVENWFEMNRYYHPHSKSKNISTDELYDILEHIPTIIEAEVQDG